MDNLYIFLNSSANSNTKNNFLDFTVSLPFDLNLMEGKWEVGLCDISFVKKNGGYPSMYICCDSISPSLINSNLMPILRFIPELKGRYNKSFVNIYYFDLLSTSLNKIRIYIYIENYDGKSFLDETLYCTLHLRKKRS